MNSKATVLWLFKHGDRWKLHNNHANATCFVSYVIMCHVLYVHLPIFHVPCFSMTSIAHVPWTHKLNRRLHASEICFLKLPKTTLALPHKFSAFSWNQSTMIIIQNSSECNTFQQWVDMTHENKLSIVPNAVHSATASDRMAQDRDSSFSIRVPKAFSIT